MQNAAIISAGSYAPEQIIPNSYFDEMLGEDVDTWLREFVQIYERRWCREDESTADLAEHAAVEALTEAGISADALDLIIVATDTPEFISPSTASVLQERIGATNAGTFDINTACAGFVTALDVGAKYIRADEEYQYVLVVGAYAMSKYLNKSDKKTVTLFADGAGAVLLKAEKETNRGFLASKLISMGNYNSWMGIYGGGTHQPVDAAMIKAHDHQLKFVKKFPKELNPDTWAAMANTMSQKSAVPLEQVAQFFITQLNINAIWDTMDQIGISRDKAHTIMHHYGYTGSACIPMAFHDAWKKGLVKQGDVVQFIGSGGGLAFASAAFRL